MMQTNYFSPVARFVPPVLIGWSSPKGSRSSKLVRFDFEIKSYRSRSLQFEFGSRLNHNVPSNKVGS